MLTPYDVNTQPAVLGHGSQVRQTSNSTNLKFLYRRDSIVLLAH